MASRALALAEARSSPSVTQPGMAGTVTVKPPSGSGVRMTGNWLMGILSFPGRRGFVVHLGVR
jgi:hypothetical protein